MQNIAADKIILKILLLLSNIFIAEVIIPTDLFLGNQYAGYCFFKKPCGSRPGI